MEEVSTANNKKKPHTWPHVNRTWGYVYGLIAGWARGQGGGAELSGHEIKQVMKSNVSRNDGANGPSPP